MKIAVLPGDGIGPEVTAQAVKVIEALNLPGVILFDGDVGGAAYKAHGHPLPPETLTLARECDAVLFGAVGDPDCDNLERHLRPEQAILGLRKELGLFANLRPAKVFAGLEHLSPLAPEKAAAIDMMFVRELNGDVYFGEKGTREGKDGSREGWDMMSYSEKEVTRIAQVAFRTARAGDDKHRVTSVDKANVLETSQVWRDAVIAAAGAHPDIALDHMYVDNAAMQIISNPERFGVILTGNLFGDILSDLASAAVGSIGLLASASMGERQTEHGLFGLYEPIHGSAPDIAGEGKANPMATILSAAMMLRHSFGLEAEATRVEAAVAKALSDGVRGGDLGGTHGTEAIGQAVRERL
ncbi:3-isopropylmalate dehydrogenase [Qipengyuania sp. S6317L1]|uniref:3-isopropylmalate dehydrogenase n=1 Tax=Qipengyuania sp. S6317L1 TaxID=2926410 RepID=UPI001FF32940|nr:3-isopropylmalate dehydrogenase [Qipengyuania sp. S6317L1]MCK0098079.1 3-isopropylmalate dehydrogenase [Qipengyuania sp. S6317L1]